MLRIGVLGAGHFGKIHIKILQEIEEFELLGFYDVDKEVSNQVSEEFGVKAFASQEELIDAVDIVDIVTPTPVHYACAVKAIRQSKHIFIEKPVTNTIEEGRKLIELANEANVKVQIGHNERFNAAFLATLPFINQPMFIETHRLSQFKPRGTDVSVVIDLMVHDIDIVLSLVKSNVRRISANGVAVVSDTPDIANARIEFDNGCVANLTASRISLKNMRKTRIFQKDAYLSIDFLKKESEVVRLSSINGKPNPLSITFDPQNGKAVKEVNFEKPEILETNAIMEEFRSFAAAIKNDTQPPVSIYDGFNAVDVAHQIIEKLEIIQENIS